MLLCNARAFAFPCSSTECWLFFVPMRYLSGWKIIIRILRNRWAAYSVGEAAHDPFLFFFSVFLPIRMSVYYS